MALSFDTARLHVFEISNNLPLHEHSALLECIPTILTPAVVENLPGYFHGIDSPERAQVWLERMWSDSRLLLVNSAEGALIGFLFAHSGNDRSAHIGYLLAEEVWGKGLASELLTEFIQQVSKEAYWVKLIGGVDRTNTVSAHLLKKLGFTERPEQAGSVIFYEYTMQQAKS